jgi:hypothetical protein
MWSNLLLMFGTSSAIAFAVAGIIEVVFRTINLIERRKK